PNWRASPSEGMDEARAPDFLGRASGVSAERGQYLQYIVLLFYVNVGVRLARLVISPGGTKEAPASLPSTRANRRPSLCPEAYRGRWRPVPPNAHSPLSPG